MMQLIFCIENVLPGKFGVAKPWYYSVDGIIMLYKSRRDPRPSRSSSRNVRFEKFDQDDEPEDLKAGIDIKKLSERFKRMHVKNLSLNLYENQITVLIGHNGAGKTTAISMLTKLYQPTAGTATIKLVKWIKLETLLESVHNMMSYLRMDPTSRRQLWDLLVNYG